MLLVFLVAVAACVYQYEPLCGGSLYVVGVWRREFPRSSKSNPELVYGIWNGASKILVLDRFTPTISHSASDTDHFPFFPTFTHFTMTENNTSNDSATMHMHNSDDRSTAQSPQHKKKTPFTPPRNNLSEDELLAKTFIDLMQIKFDRGELTRISQEPQDRKGLNDVMRTGKIIGGIVAIGTFVGLRRLPKRFMNQALSKKESILHGRDGNPFYHIARKQGPWLPHVKTRRDGSTSFHEGWVLAPLLITIDAALACFMGGIVWFVATPKLKIFEAAADIPLVPGRSAVSETLCSDFIENFKRLPKELWTPKKLDGDDVTTNIKRFVENCQRRQQVERQLRSDSALKENEPVEIPHPGVLKDLIVEMEESPEEVLVWGNTGMKQGFWLDDWAEEEDEDDW